MPSALARGSNPAAWAMMSARVCIYIYIYVAIVRSRLGMQLPFKVNARAPSLHVRSHVHVYVCLYTTASRRRRAGAASSPYSTQTESRGKDRVRTRRGQTVGEVNDAEGCSTLGALVLLCLVVTCLYYCSYICSTHFRNMQSFHPGGRHWLLVVIDWESLVPRSD